MTVLGTHPETEADVVGQLVRRARSAQELFSRFSQTQVDDVVAAVGWACYKPENARQLAALAVETTGLGSVEDKFAKNQRKTMGTLHDLRRAPSVGVISYDPSTGITEIAKPVGVVAAICPSTNPAATPTNKAMMALKGGNAIVISPSPKGAATANLLLQLIHTELEKVGAPPDLVQCLPEPISRPLTDELMRQCDLVVATGSQRNVRAAYSSGTPAIGVGRGNVPVIIDQDADLRAAAKKIHRSKVFDYATSCSSENAVLISRTIYRAAVAELTSQGGHMLAPGDKARLQSAMWQDGRLSDRIVGQAPEVIASLAGIEIACPDRVSFFMVEEDGVGATHPFSGEKLSPVLAVYVYDTFDEAVQLVKEILEYQGAGHSVGIHSRTSTNIERLAREVNVARVIVNQSHALANGGSFDNGLNFTLTMGCGTWAGNSISENLNYRHFLNITRLVLPIPAATPTEADLWGDYLARYGG